MLPIVHAFTSLILAGFLYPFVGWQAVFAFIGGFLIDADHNLYCAFNFKDISFKRCYEWHKQDKGRDELHLFHTVEVWIILLILSIFSKIAFLFSIGLFLHMMLDFLNIYTNKLYGRRAVSIIAWTIRRTKKSL